MSQLLLQVTQRLQALTQFRLTQKLTYPLLETPQPYRPLLSRLQPMRVSAPSRATRLLHRLPVLLPQVRLQSLQAGMWQLLRSAQSRLSRITRLKLPVMRLLHIPLLSLLQVRRRSKLQVTRLKQPLPVFWSGVLWIQAKRLTGLQFQVHKPLVGARWMLTRLLIGKR